MEVFVGRNFGFVYHASEYYSVPESNGEWHANVPLPEDLWDNCYTTAPARPTAVCRTIQHSQESLLKLAERYDLNPKTVQK